VESDDRSGAGAGSAETGDVVEAGEPR
jgi:hypothetical protein